MKIAIQVTIKQLTEIIVAIQEDVIIKPPETIAEKANKYLFESVFKKILKKQIDKLESHKEFQFTVSYAEALALYQNICKVSINDNYRMAVVIKFTNALHQKLISG